RQVFVTVAEVILSELAGRITLVLQQLGDRGIFRFEANRCGRHADLREAGAESALTGDEGRAPGRARLLAIRVRELHSLPGEAIDVRRAVAHHTVAVAAEVGDADVVAPDHQNVRLVGPLPLPRRHRDLLVALPPRDLTRATFSTLRSDGLGEAGPFDPRDA